ncbi:MAG: IS5 family transposase [Lysobacteraceae bacterium]
MEISAEQFAQIEHCLPLQRGNVSMTNLQVVNAILYVAEHGCKWRGLPKRFGNWHTVYTRMSRWPRQACWIGCSPSCRSPRSFASRLRLFRSTRRASRFIPTGPVLEKKGPQSIGKSRGGWNTKVHMVAADERTAITFGLSLGQMHDAPAGRALLTHLGPVDRPVHLLMDRAYEGDETRQLALDLASSRLFHQSPIALNRGNTIRALYKRRNEVERLFRRLKGYRRIFPGLRSST